VKNKKHFIAILTVLSCFLFTPVVFAMIPAANTANYAWGENVGWANLNSTNGGVTVENDGLTGFVWLENIGWVKLDYDGVAGATNTTSTNWGVTNDGSGNLGGYAWSENAGWINFHPTNSQVTIDSNGNFSGYAWGENIGWVKFDHAQTSYRPTTTWSSAASYTITSSANSNGSISPSGSVAISLGGSQTFTFAADSGYGILNVTVDGISQGAINSYTFTNVSASHTISVSFRLVRGSGGGGNIVFGGQISTPPVTPQTPPVLTPQESPPPSVNLSDPVSIKKEIERLQALVRELTPPTASPVFTQTLTLGTRNNDVKLLQDKLKELGFFPREVQSNGRFGPTTLKAVKDFQLKYNIVKPGVYGYGIVGPATRKVLNGM
jgi:hypothetical protein